MSAKKNILIVYGDLEYPMRATLRDLIYCFRKYSNHNCFFYTPDMSPLMSEKLGKIDFDLIVFTSTLIDSRWLGKEKFKSQITDHLQFTKLSKAVKVVHPQDEWIYTNILNDFIIEFDIAHVFTVAPQSEWKKIYSRVDFTKVKFHGVLTGYIDEKTFKKLSAYTSSISNRSIDIGYRAFKAPAWLGSHGFLKTTIAEVFNKFAPEAGFKVDISTEPTSVILGDNWYKFLAECKYFIGVEGGSTVIDPDGEIWKKGVEYLKQNPHAGFEEVERHCFPGMDGNLKLIAISPRHLECCATKTCQILIEGSYNGILQPGLHYIPLKSDFSNLDEVFLKMKDENLRTTIIESAYNDIVLSKKYTYQAYVEFVLKTSLRLDQQTFGLRQIHATLMAYRFSFLERDYWARKRSHLFPNELTLRNILVKIYVGSGLLRLKKLILR